MAKRRKLETPSAEALSQIEEEFRAKRTTRPAVAPISQVAAEAAEQAEVLGVETRAKLAEAEVFRDADAQGLVMAEIPIERIRAEELVRDRAVMDRGELNELRASILKNGLRLPIEVYELPEKTATHDYGLISGYRRLVAFQEALSGTGQGRFEKIKAIVRKPAGSAESIVAMVEENEVRADLSHFERGRIAVLSAQSGAFVNVEEAVERLFPFASKAKRSKVRSFALIFEELGDLLSFPERLSERQGLSVASALRAGAEHELREKLALRGAESAEQEWEQITEVLSVFENKPKDPAKGGRPKSNSAPKFSDTVTTPRGVKISWQPVKSGGYNLNLSGGIESEEFDAIISMMQDHLS